MIEALELSRRFGRQWALRRFSGRFEAGTVSAVVGHNGAGKSTLVGLIAGLLRPTEGALSVLGHDCATGPRPPAVRSGLGVMLHQPYVYPDLSGAENLELVSALYGQPLTSKARHSALHRVGLDKAARRAARTYSRGMLQRLSLARLLVQTDARAWLLDEPATGLDSEGHQLVVELVSELRDSGRAVVMVSHQAALVEALADVSLTLERGRLAS